MTRRVEFTSGDATCVGHLHLAEGPAPRPRSVMCHCFGGTQDTPSIVANADGFVRAGYVALTCDYRNFGESGGEQRQLVDIELRRYPYAHFEFYRDDIRKEVLADQLAFLYRVLGAKN